MKKAYVAPNIKFSTNGSLEGVFASLDECGNERVFNVKGSGLVTMTDYCHDSNNWLINLNDDDLDD